MAKQPKSKRDLIAEINGLSEEINNILSFKMKDRYFEGIALLYSFIEDILKWLIFTQIVWNKSQRIIRPEEFEKLRAFCNQSNLFALLNLGLAVDLLDHPLYEKLNCIREERNSIVHQYWLYVHKGRKLIFRKKLERLAGAANFLVNKFNDLVQETGMDESYGFFEVSTGKAFVAI